MFTSTLASRYLKLFLFFITVGMGQQLHDKSEIFKIIYKALLLQIIRMEFKKYVDTNIVFSNLISLHLDAYLF